MSEIFNGIDLPQLVNTAVVQAIQHFGILNDSRHSAQNNQPIRNRYLRLKQILGDPDADPPIPPILPISKSSWYAGIKLGRYPAGIKISPRTVVWRADEVFAIAANQPMGDHHEAH